MNSFAICIFVACVVLLQPGKVLAVNGVLTGVCNTPSGHACVTAGTSTAGGSRGTYSTCVNNVPTGAPIECPTAIDLNFVCYPGGYAGSSICGPDLVANDVCKAGNGNLTVVSGNCRNYVQCLGATANILNACSFGQEFSPTDKICKPTALANCNVPTPTAPTGTCFPLTTQEDPTSCRHYYKCSLLGARNRLQCPFGLLYSTNLRLCLPTANCGTRPRQ